MSHLISTSEATYERNFDKAQNIIAMQRKTERIIIVCEYVYYDVSREITDEIMPTTVYDAFARTNSV